MTVYALRGEVTGFALRREVTVGTGAEGGQEEDLGVRARGFVLDVRVKKEGSGLWRGCKVWVVARSRQVP